MDDAGIVGRRKAGARLMFDPAKRGRGQSCSGRGYNGHAVIGRDWYDGTCLLYLVVKGKTLRKSGSLPPLIIPVTSHDIGNGRLTPPM